MRALALSILLSLFLIPQVRAQSLPEYAELHNHLKQRLSAARDRETRAEQSAQRSNQLIMSAQTVGDNDAATMAREALAAAERALRNARALRERRERELKEFEKGIADAVAAGRPIGYPILKRQGEISLISPGSRREYDGSSLKPGDQIKTGPNSTIVLLIPDGSRIEIGPNSTFEVAPDKPSAFRFLSGEFREVVKCMRIELTGGYCRRTRVTVSNLCACVRGTEYSAEILDAATVRLEVFEGVVDLRDDADRLVASVRPGMRVTVRRRGGIWTILPDGVAMQRFPEPGMVSRLSSSLR